jgi:hypothetical protein
MCLGTPGNLDPKSKKIGAVFEAVILNQKVSN